MSEIRIVTPLSNKSTSAKHDRQLGSSYFIRTNGRFDPIKTRVLDQNQSFGPKPGDFYLVFWGDQNTRDILIHFICFFFLGWSNPSSHDQQPTPHSQKKGHIDRLSPCSVKDTWARSWGSDKMGSNKKGQSKLLDLRFKNWESTWNPIWNPLWNPIWSGRQPSKTHLSSDHSRCPARHQGPVAAGHVHGAQETLPRHPELSVLSTATRPGKHTKSDGKSPCLMGKSPF